MSRLRVCVYGSSSPNTPSAFTNAAFNLGALLAKKDYVCVNGGGKFGCMGAVNDGADANGGEIVGVIHAMFLVDGAEYLDAGSLGNKRHSLIVCKGEDLTERKAKLVEGADCIVVLPGGTGTWDELWEMACRRNLGLYNKPIIAVNVDGFYDGFRVMLERAHTDKLLANKPKQIVTFVSSAEEAVEESEKQVAALAAGGGEVKKLKLKGTGRWWRNALRKYGTAGVFVAGVVLGGVLARGLEKRRRL
jgi:uncharacterized protein (TIGR00730 family)